MILSDVFITHLLSCIYFIYTHRLRLVNWFVVSYPTIMFAKLGDYLDEYNIQRPTRYVSSSGEEFVVLPAKEYSLLTGIDIETLPTMESFDSVPHVPEEIKERVSNEAGSAAALAAMPLEEEFDIDRLPL
ncbi:MAG: hypothetical protein A3J55_04020 [Candidatus Ryanbacteria bacterium RIFCSPHIGHO2_02_FULL_45_17b]|uniref:Uncharacterized protein n=1 Tax=Candidatus Ryanbacteria bacterium RIFCSPHIGHO2_01_FULL_45_22 TaxID=1802114 RepID=A0A1G2G1D4_9BACT|nr:MAG: hypothetical protein A2719_02160 [Candidatus Ryanbacteria bacterium RIFCSPHIGHO2_01_FULL_45_22]OGZ46441.1 MAG: hypothetical protein A3J55_04020 [Candidatus Ryanbacteria bacterium RIFCSPHIGHO2_02_FULL_45_17b]